MKPAYHNPFAAALIAAATLSTSSYAQTTLLTDNFNAETSFTANPNADQGGLLAPATYTVGNPFGAAYQRRGTGVMELGYDGTTATQGSRIFTDVDYTTVANTLNSPVRITFDINAAQVDWVGFVLGTTSAWLDAGGTTTEFSALFRNDGTGNKWVNGANQGATATDTSSLITLELRNTAGTGSAFNGTGSVAQLWRGTTDLGTYTLDQLSATSGKFAFCTWNGNLGAGATIDNLNITATVTAAPNRWSGAVDGNWDEVTANFTGGSFATIKTNGATSALFGDTSGTLAPVTNSSLTIATAGVEIADVIFDNNTVPYSLASGGTAGIKGASNLVKSGLGTLTVGNVNTYTGTTTISSGTLALSGGNNRLPVTTALTLTSPGVLRLDGNNQAVASLASNGRVVNGNATPATFTVNNSAAATFSGNLGGTGTDEDNLALAKTGSGTLTLSTASSYTGGTTVNGGTLVCSHEPIGIANTAIGAMDSNNTVTINNGGILTGTVNNWLSSTQVASGGSNAISVVVNPGGQLKGADNRITGLGNVTLNGGNIEVSNGLGAFGWFASFTLGGDVTVGGSAPSTITTASGAGANAAIYLANGSNGTGGTRSFIVNDVTTSAASDLVVSARLAKGTVIKDGLGTVEIAAGETGTEAPASWEIANGSFLLANGATFEFRVTDSASNSVIEASGGTGSAAFNGTLNINTAAVTVTTGTWPLIDVAGLGATYGPSLAVTGFTLQPDGHTWTKPAGANKFSFDQNTGTLTLAPAATDYETWGAAYGLTAGSEGGDLDGDGLTNRQEYAFGLIPNSGASVNPITVQINKSTGAFSYTRRATPATTGLGYTIWYSTTLQAGSWLEDTGALEGTPTLSGEVENVPVTISSSLLTNPKLFIQVRAQ